MCGIWFSDHTSWTFCRPLNDVQAFHHLPWYSIGISLSLYHRWQSNEDSQVRAIIISLAHDMSALLKRQLQLIFHGTFTRVSTRLQLLYNTWSW